MQKISQNPMAREMNTYHAPMLAYLGQFGLSPDGITFAGMLPNIVLEMPEFKNAALGLANLLSFSANNQESTLESHGAMSTRGQPV